jgi:hypothetical protein
VPSPGLLLAYGISDYQPVKIGINVNYAASVVI